MAKDEIAPTPPSGGGNFATSERDAAVDARAAFDALDGMHVQHSRLVADIHAGIVAFGRRLAVGRMLHPATKAFGRWCIAAGVTTGRLGAQQERSAAMRIAELVDAGLSLAGCNNTWPTDILKWARREHPDAFRPDAPVSDAARQRKIDEAVERAGQAMAAYNEWRRSTLEARIKIAGLLLKLRSRVKSDAALYRLCKAKGCDRLFPGRRDQSAALAIAAIADLTAADLDDCPHEDFPGIARWLRRKGRLS